MKINLFLAQTEYHLLQSINIATTLYSHSDFENLIYVVQTERRLTDIERIKTIDNIAFEYLKDITEQEKNQALRKVKCDKFIFFQEDSLFNCNLANYYKNKYNTGISLAPDGYKPYAVYNKKHEALSMLRDTFVAYTELIKKNIFPTVLQWSQHYQYASTTILDEIFLTNPDQFPTRKRHRKIKITEIPQFDDRSLLNASSIFNVDPDSFPVIEKGIYYFNQPFKEQLDGVEIDFLKNLINLHPEQKIYIKLHPVTTKLKKEKYLKLPEVCLIESKVPAELFILNLKNSILFTGWSTVLATNNPSCNLYFNSSIYKNQGSKAIDQFNLILLPHIKLISNPWEMEFPV